MEFAELSYEKISSYHHLLPSKVLEFLPYMIERNWLYNYSTVEGIGRTLTGLSRRVKFPNNMDKAIEDLRLYYPQFEEEFHSFFSQLITFVRSKKE
jgi:acyl carrier protein phosphodiesterase